MHFIVDERNNFECNCRTDIGKTQRRANPTNFPFTHPTRWCSETITRSLPYSQTVNGKYSRNDYRVYMYGNSKPKIYIRNFREKPFRRETLDKEIGIVFAHQPLWSIVLGPLLIPWWDMTRNQIDICVPWHVATGKRFGQRALSAKVGVRRTLHHKYTHTHTRDTHIFI